MELSMKTVSAWEKAQAARTKANIFLLMVVNLNFLKKNCFHVDKFGKKSVILVAEEQKTPFGVKK
jgi:hypothetical protein